MKTAQEEIRKGPWTEQEDFKLVSFVGLFGDRRWDFIAQVSGLNRTGKSCRLRWVNYLHPGLKRGKMTPQEERLVLEYHAKWGNRWSRIARKLPGRTDNEIKNYWRTHMRKKAQEKKRASSPSSASSNTCSLSSDNKEDSFPSMEAGEKSFYDTGGPDIIASADKKEEVHIAEQEYSLEEIWKDIDLPEESNINPVKDVQSTEEECGFYCPPLLTSPSWEYPSDSLWVMGEEESKMFNPLSNQFFCSYEYGRDPLTG